jgi:hypothetical protein
MINTTLYSYSNFFPAPRRFAAEMTPQDAKFQPVSRRAIEAASFVLGLSADQQAVFKLSQEAGCSDNILKSAGLTGDLSAEAQTTLPLFLQHCLNKKVLVQYESIELKVDADAGDADILLEFINNKDQFQLVLLAFRFCDGRRADPADDQLWDYSLRTFPIVAAAASDPPVSFDVEPAKLRATVIPVYGPFKEKYGHVAHSCEEHLLFLQQHVWGVSNPPVPTRVFYQSSRKGGKPLEIAKLDLPSSTAKPTAADRLIEQLTAENWVPKCQVGFLAPPAATSAIVLISAGGDLHDRLLERLVKSVCEAFSGEVPVRQGEAHVVDLSWTVLHQAWPPEKSSPLMDELLQLQAEGVLGKATRIDLSNNQLSMDCYGAEYSFILANCPELKELDLQNNQLLPEEAVFEWFREMIVKHPGIRIDARGNVIRVKECPADLAGPLILS